MTVTAVGADDVQDLADMICEMDRFYADPGEYTAQQAVASVREHLIDCPGRGALIARRNTDAVGMAIYAAPWPTVNLQPALFLKDIFVREHARGLGVGRALLSHLAKLAQDGGYSRVDWTTDRGNTHAREVYRCLEIPVIEEKLFYRVEGELLSRLANDA